MVDITEVGVLIKMQNSLQSDLICLPLILSELGKPYNSYFLRQVILCIPSWLLIYTLSFKVYEYISVDLMIELYIEIDSEVRASISKSKFIISVDMDPVSICHY